MMAVGPGEQEKAAAEEHMKDVEEVRGVVEVQDKPQTDSTR